MSYEIEIKSLIGDKNSADVFRNKLLADENIKELGTNKQLNHYFVGSKESLTKLYSNIKEYVPDDLKDKFNKVVHDAEKFSVRTREIDGNTVMFVIKASINETTSENGTARMEIEFEYPGTLSALDELIINSGFEYQAKWSREREEYQLGDTNITLDKNAGYGYLTEFERVVDDSDEVDDILSELRTLMHSFGLEELPQDRLERMFEYYNTHWEEYYGTDNIFTIN